MNLRLLFLCLFVSGTACSQPAKYKSAPAVKDTTYSYQVPSRDGTGKFYMGREIARIMDASGSDWLERPERPEQENTEVAISNMNLEPGSVVADIGAGTGYYTFRIAPRVPHGKVYAVEIQDELITILNRKINETGSRNIEVVRGDTLSVNLPDSTVDLAFMVDVYHELSWPREIIRSISRSLKSDGRILLIEYRGEDPAVQIKPLHKTTVEQLSREMEANGFIIDRQVKVMPIQHFIVFKRKS